MSTTINEDAFDAAMIDSAEGNFPKARNPVSKEDVSEALAQADKNDEKIIVEFAENEKNKRDLKPKILHWVCAFVLVQLILMNAILVIVIIGLVVGDSRLLFIHAIDPVVFPELFSFLKYYISATLVELLGMLFFMIRKVFDNSIIDIFRLNKEHREKDKKDRKEHKSQSQKL